MDIKYFSNNDNFAQCVRKLRRTEEEKNQKAEEIKTCNHLFVKVKKGETLVGFHSSDYEYIPDSVECVKCGLTKNILGMRHYCMKVMDK